MDHEQLVLMVKVFGVVIGELFVYVMLPLITIIVAISLIVRLILWTISKFRE